MGLSVKEQEVLLVVTPYIKGLVAAYSLKFGYGTLVDQVSANGSEVRYWMTKSEEVNPEQEKELQDREDELRRNAMFFLEHTELSPDSVIFVIRRQPDGTKTCGYEPKPYLPKPSGLD